MKEKFKQIEAVLQNFIEANMAKLFGEEQAENELASRLVVAMQDNIHTGEGGEVHAPNLFTITVHPDYAEDLSSNRGLLESLAEVIQQAGKEEGFRFAVEPGISILPDPEMVASEYAVQAYRTEDDLTETQALETIDTDEGDIPPQAFLIVGGSQIFSLECDVVNLGRKLDNNLVLEDPRVSRHHAQLRAVRGRFMLFDLGSAGGTFVNGERISQLMLHPGDVISLAGLPLVYGQDAVRNVSETQEYKAPVDSGDGTTKNIRDLTDLDLGNF
ncbi:MAG: DUF2662 domain-containing protein [Chloroflexi bacterium]|nr:MAG: DUF2662 domain-containing protein [Chloroflexota bacterium]MBL1193399.1 DUF2662 domain-containing protein [Chloroflexota bacterium]NOH10691.1 DUF3662 domain-containing protein [Chloroflexota bacterium]